MVRWRISSDKKLKDELAADEIEKVRALHRKEYIEQRMMKLELGHTRRLKYGRYRFREKETIDDMSGLPKLPLVIKADVNGSLEAILNCLDTYEEDDVLLDILDFGVGGVSENDIVLAKQFKGIIYAFNTPVGNSTAKMALDMEVPIKEFNIIYKLVDQLKMDINSRLPLVPVDDVFAKA